MDPELSEPQPPGSPVVTNATLSRASSFTERASWRISSELAWCVLLLLLGCILDFCVTRATGRTGLVGKFFRVSNWPILLLMAVPTSLLLAQGKLDLSMTALAAVANVVAARYFESAGAVGAIAMAIGLAALLGALNGALVGLVGLNSTLVTITTALLFRMTGAFLSSGTTVSLDLSIDDQTLSWIMVTLAVVLAGGAYLFAQFTTLGRRALIQAPPDERSNQKRLVTFFLYLLSSVSAGVVGVLLLLYYHASDPRTESGQDLAIIAAALIGGTTFGRGAPYILGAALAALLISFLEFALIMLVTDQAFSTICIAILLLLFLLLGHLYHRLLDRRYAAAGMKST